MTSLPYYLDQPIRVTDLNYGDHLGITQLSGMAHNARLCFLKSLGLSESDVGGPGVVVAESNIVIKKECFHGDVLRFYVTLNSLSRSQFKSVVRVFNGSELIASVEERMICYDYTRKRPVAIPESLAVLISELPSCPELE